MRLKFNLSNDKTQKATTLTLPAKETELQRVCSALGVSNDKNGRVKIIDVENQVHFNRLLKNTEQNLDELNYLAKRLDSLGTGEINTVLAVAEAKELTTAKDLINLTFNTHCYSVLSDFSDLDKLGENLYLNEKGSASADELQQIDGRKYVEQMIASNPTVLVSDLGFVYQNSNTPQELYNGETFPAYWYEPCIITLEVTADDKTEFLFLPCEESEVFKTAYRLDADVKTIKSSVHEHNIPENIYEIFSKDGKTIGNFNKFAKILDEVGEKEFDYLSKLVDYIKIDTPSQLETLTKSMFEFEIYPNIYSPEEYGRFMICESERFDYDENLEEFIDFRAYGMQKTLHENGTFTDKGYINYLGYDNEMAQILNEKLDIGIVLDDFSETLRLYMPLTVTSFEIENDYGDFEICDYEEELDSSELCGYEDELHEFLTDYSDHVPEKRGLMEYYGEKDSVNAKVQSFFFEFEQIGREVYGVAVCQIKAPLDQKELTVLKDYITGQAADGFGEGLEQQDFKLGGRNVNISLWNSDNDWEIKTADEMDFNEQSINFCNI
ncbi:MAG: antirestriction protein ArdA [Clostridia bacterium]